MQPDLKLVTTHNRIEFDDDVYEYMDSENVEGEEEVEEATTHLMT